MTSEEGTEVDTATSSSGQSYQYQTEDLPDYVKARSYQGLPKAVQSRDELQDSDYVLIIDPETGQRYETDWASAKMVGLDAYASISDRATRDGQNAAQDLPRGELNEISTGSQHGDRDANSAPLYEPDPSATLLTDTLALHGGLTGSDLDGLVGDYIHGHEEEVLGALESDGLGRDSLGHLVEQVTVSADSQARKELSREDYEYLEWASGTNPEVKKLVMVQGWKVSTGKASMSWPEFASLVRAKMSRA